MFQTRIIAQTQTADIAKNAGINVPRERLIPAAD